MDIMAEDIFIRSDGVTIELIPASHCKWCSKPISKKYFSLTGECWDCHTGKNKPPIRIHAVGIYRLRTANNRISQEIWELKRDSRIADKLGECMVYVINNHYPYLKDVDLIVPAPSSDSNNRGYNQALLLAKYISKEIGIECRDIISMIGDHYPRHKPEFNSIKSDSDRSYACNERLFRKRILLIDDTYIKGITVRECVRVLKENHAEEVQALVVGRKVDDRHMKHIMEEDENV